MKNCLYLLLLAAAGASIFAPRAAAQISVTLEPTKQIYVAHEPVYAVLTITNRAGSDVVLRGPGNAPWLAFEVIDSQGHLVSPSKNVDYEPVIIPAGQTLQRKFAINQTYSMSTKGLYRVRANVYFPNLKQYFNSKQNTIHVSDGRELWHQVVGVPSGREGEGTYRRYTLLTFTNGTEKNLYIRVHDERTGAVYATFSLGQVIMVRNPERTIDQQNRLHLLHMGAPRTYAHTVIDVDGKVVSRDIYREDGGNRPQLAPSGVGDVVVVGGISQAEDEANPLDADIHRLSQRPGGLPRVDRVTGALIP